MECTRFYSPIYSFFFLLLFVSSFSILQYYVHRMADKCIVFLNEQQQQQQVKQGHEERNQLQCAEESKAAIEAKTVAHTPTCNTNNNHNNNNSSNHHHHHHHHQTSTSTSLSAFPNDNDTAAYLETPVLDDMEQNSTSSAADGLLLHHRHHHTHFCKRNVNAAAPKPKRLSDEFGSDGEESNELLSDQDAACDAENPSSGHSESVCTGAENLHENKKMMSTTVDLNRSMSTLPREHSSSSSDDNENGGVEHIAEQSVSVADVVEELTNQGDEHQQHRIVIENNIFFDNTASSNSSTTITNNNIINNNASTNTNVQSMDAIERRDFISEQDACESVSGSSCLLNGNSLIINRTNGDEQRLNLNLLGNTFSQGVEKIITAAQELDASDNCKNATESNGRSSSSSNAGNNATESANTHLSSTPTSSRRVKRSRLYGPSEASSSKGLNLSKDSVGATSSSGLVLRKHLNYSDLLQKPKHKRSPFYTNSSNDSSSSDNNQANDVDQLAAESASLRDEPKADAHLCPSCTNDAKDLVDAEYNEIDGEYEEDEDSQTIGIREPVDSQSVDMREPTEGPLASEPADESKWIAAGQRMAVDWSSAGYRLTKPSTSKAAASNEPSTSNRNSGCCDCSDDNVPMLLKERGKTSIVVSIRKKGDRFVEHSEYELQPIAGVDLSGGHASGASTSYRRRTTSNNGVGHSSAQGNNDDVNGMMNLDAESNTCADWPCESNSDCEEVCTCRDDTDDDIIFR